jgi:DNA processing protein
VDDDARASWLRLTLIPGVGSQSQRNLLKAFGLPERVFLASRTELQQVVAPAVAASLLDSDVSASVATALAWAGQPGHHLLTLGDADYPQQLLQTEDPPTLLYARGRIEFLNRPCIAVVGSRNCTPQGCANAQSFAAALSQCGLTVVSGLACGVDAAAHRGALSGVGSSIAVVGTGIDRVYPASNRELAMNLADNGVIVSEFPIGTPALAANFPRRNRVISGLSKGVLVVEAAERSGSLITARLAAEQGREVFAIPGSIHSPLSKGCHRLIKQGAKLVDQAQDILEELNLSPMSHAPVEITAPARENGLLVAMGFDPLGIDVLAERSGLSAERLVSALLELELAGRVAPLPGGLYQRLT